MPLPHAPRSVITGAGSGFGRALALELAKRKAHLVLADLNLEAAEETVRLVLAAGASSARAVRCDVTKYEQVEALAAGCERPIDLVVNNAGVSTAGNIGELPVEDWRWTLDVDLYGVIYGCHAFVPILRAQGHGYVLNMASAAGLLNPPTMGAYNVAKAGVIALSETLASEVSSTKIGVTVLCPTFFKTNIASSGKFTDAKKRAIAEKMVSRGKEPGEVARAALASVDKGQLYCIPMIDGVWASRLKRLSPELFRTLTNRAAKRILR